MRNLSWGSPHCDPQITSDSTGPSAAPGAGTNAGLRQRDTAIFDMAESITQPQDGNIPTRSTLTIHESLLSVLNAQTCDRPEAPETNHTQKHTGDKTYLKRRDHACCPFRETALLEKKMLSLC